MLSRLLVSDIFTDLAFIPATSTSKLDGSIRALKSPSSQVFGSVPSVFAVSSKVKSWSQKRFLSSLCTLCGAYTATTVTRSSSNCRSKVRMRGLIRRHVGPPADPPISNACLATPLKTTATPLRLVLLLASFSAAETPSSSPPTESHVHSSRTSRPCSSLPRYMLKS